MSFFENEMTRLGIKQEEISRICNVTRQTVGSWAKGTTPINSDKLALLFKVGFDVQYVVTGVRSSSPCDFGNGDTAKSELVESLAIIAKNLQQQAKILEGDIELLLNLK